MSTPQVLLECRDLQRHGAPGGTPLLQDVALELRLGDRLRPGSTQEVDHKVGHVFFSQSLLEFRGQPLGQQVQVLTESQINKAAEIADAVAEAAVTKVTVHQVHLVHHHLAVAQAQAQADVVKAEAVADVQDVRLVVANLNTD